MPLFFNTHSRYPRSAIAFRIIFGAQILLYLGMGINLSFNNSKLTSEDGETYGPKAFFSMTAMCVGLWRYIDETTDAIGDFVVEAADYTRQTLGL